MTPRRVTRLTALLHRVRTEGGSPVRQSMAVALGLFIGSLPLIGLHLALCLAFGRLFKLNLPKVYLASNISNPFFAPVLFGAEIQVGAWLRMGHMYSAGALDQIRLTGLAIDIAIGSLVVGTALAVAGALLTFAVVHRPEGDGRIAQLLATTAERYLPAGIAAWELSRSKLQMDPVYTTVLADGVLPDTGTIVDIGCGRGLMLALIATAREEYQAGRWPAWPPPPRTAALVGIEHRARVAARARKVLEHDARVDAIDARGAELPVCRGVLMIDVLHMLPIEDQNRLVANIHRALESGGVLIVREADRAGGWRFHVVRAGNWLRGVAEGHFNRRFAFRTADEWDAWLGAHGFVVSRQQAPAAAPRANFLIYARRR